MFSSEHAVGVVLNLPQACPEETVPAQRELLQRAALHEQIPTGSKEYRRTAYALCGHAADMLADIGVERATNNGEMERRSYCGEMMDPASQSYIPVATAAAGTYASI